MFESVERIKLPSGAVIWRGYFVKWLRDPSLGFIGGRLLHARAGRASHWCQSIPVEAPIAKRDSDVIWTFPINSIGEDVAKYRRAYDLERRKLRRRELKRGKTTGAEAPVSTTTRAEGKDREDEALASVV